MGDTGFGEADDLDDDEDALLFSQHEAQGEELMDGIEALDALLMRAHEALEDLKTYFLTHPHMREVPRMSRDNIENVFKWSENWHKLKRVNNMPATWSGVRRGTRQTSCVPSALPSLNLDPSLLNPGVEEQGSINPPDTTSPENIELMFFSRTLRPKDMVCPFSDSTRLNPCKTHTKPLSRKDLIKNHLEKMRKIGGNEEHSLNDPLWNGFTVQWFLTDRPMFTDEQRHSAQSVSQSRYYKKRKAMQEEHADAMKALYEASQITEDEYKKYLIGDKRRQFITETKTEKRVKAEMTTEMKSM